MGSIFRISPTFAICTVFNAWNALNKCSSWYFQFVGFWYIFYQADAKFLFSFAFSGWRMHKHKHTHTNHPTSALFRFTVRKIKIINHEIYICKYVTKFVNNRSYFPELVKWISHRNQEAIEQKFCTKHEPTNSTQAVNAKANGKFMVGIYN